MNRSRRVPNNHSIFANKAKWYGMVLLLAGLGLSGCSLQKQIPDNKVVLKKATVKNAPEKHEYQLNTLIKQKPNKRLLSTFRLSMWTYLMAGGQVPPRDSIPQGKWFIGKAWKSLTSFIRDDLGDPPVILDSTKMAASSKQMETYMTDHGHLNATVEPKVDTQAKQAVVNYRIHSKEPYHIQDIDYFIQDRYLHKLITEEREPLLDSGGIYSSQKLRKERQNITKFLNNKGFYNFTNNFIEFRVDTTVGTQQVNVAVIVANPADYNRHRQFTIDEVYINPSYSVRDTFQKDTIQKEGYTFISNRKKLLLNSEVLISKIPIAPGSLYTSNQKQTTYNRLAQLDIYKFVDIRFFNTRALGERKGKIDCYIQLTPAKRRSLNFEQEFTLTDQNDQFAASVVNNGRFYGIAPNVTYRNKNLFRRGITWDLNLRGAYEFSNDLFTSQTPQNIFEIGANTSLKYYGSFLPRTVTDDPISKTVQTSLNLRYLIEGNINYQRNTASFSYTWRFNNNLSTIYATPASINLVNTSISRDTFARQIQEFDNPFIQSIFDTYTITGGKLTWVYNDEPLVGDQHWLIRWNLEPAGNLLYLFYDNVVPFFQQQVFNTGTQDSRLSDNFKYGFGDVGFYTFTKTQADFRYYLPGSGNNELVLRLSPGVGIGYGNTNFMPFEKRFFVGGSNSIRAWAVRDLGPGSYQGRIQGNDAQNIDLRVFQVGDVKIEGNIEYRFDLFYRFRGALFADFGNVWLLTEPGGMASNELEQKFFDKGKFDGNFYKEMAIGTGFGLRMDWTFFILRLDFGWPVRNPKKPIGERWTSYNRDLNWFANEARLNIGVGYPF